MLNVLLVSRSYFDWGTSAGEPSSLGPLPLMDATTLFPGGWVTMPVFAKLSRDMLPWRDTQQNFYLVIFFKGHIWQIHLTYSNIGLFHDCETSAKQWQQKTRSWLGKKEQPRHSAGQVWLSSAFLPSATLLGLGLHFFKTHTCAGLIPVRLWVRDWACKHWLSSLTKRKIIMFNTSLNQNEATIERTEFRPIMLIKILSASLKV